MDQETEARRSIGVAILAKAPIAGLAKTRLIPHLGAAGAAALQGWLLRRAVATAVAAQLGPVSLWCAPDEHHADFIACQGLGAGLLRRQPEGNLGQRMNLAVVDSPTAAGTLVIGTDCPVLSVQCLRQAADQLRQHDATVVPAEDGGYVLIGMRRAWPEIFQDVDWSTPRVMAQTRQRLSAAKLRWSELPPLWDVDRGEDFARLVALYPELSSLITE